MREVPTLLGRCWTEVETLSFTPKLAVLTAMDDIFHGVKRVLKPILYLLLFLCGIGAGWYGHAASYLNP